MANYEVYFESSSVPKTGLSLTWESLNNRSTGAAASQPSFTEVGSGWYRFTLNTTVTLLGVINGGSSLADSERYLPCKFTINDGGGVVVGSIQGSICICTGIGIN